MTRKEAIGLLSGLMFKGKLKEALDMAIKALEQEPILDKIRAEIKQYQSDYDVHGTEYDRTAWKAFNRCLQMIEKENEEEKGE